MYLSKVRLVNWRSYKDQTFEFPKPTSRRPLVLVGAMNGHGKTSFLIALYVGMFGRFGIRYCEGYALHGEDEAPFYRKALKLFRRIGADPDQPTAIELTFSPTLNDKAEEEIRIVRRWHFTSSGAPKLGDSFEELQIYSDSKPLPRIPDVDTGTRRLEKLLFPPHTMPAFFFDGEQAQTLITNAGTPGIKKAIEVMFGTKILEEVHEQIRDFINHSHSEVGGKRAASKLEEDLQVKLSEREKLNQEIATLQQKEAELSKQKDQVEQERKHAQERLRLLGGAHTQDLSVLQEQLKQSQKRRDTAERELIQSVRQLGLSLALSRLDVAIQNRLEAEELREVWERLRSGTLDRADRVLEAAMPDPPDKDPLLGHLPSDVREKVRERFRSALEQIYHPPPQGCAAEYLLGHAMGEQRKALQESIQRSGSESGSQLRRKIQEYLVANSDYKDVEDRILKFNNLPREVDQLVEEINKLNNQMGEVLRRLHEAENQIKRLKGDLHNVNAEIGVFQERLAKLKPEQKRIAVAERVHRVLDKLLEELRPLAVNHLEKLVTRHFTAIIDQRFKGAQVVIPSDGPPELRRTQEDSQLIETMSGFEKRSFGIAFSLALAELTQRRLPLVIDTPLGNADSEYRPRLLRALTDVDLDQIIMLTHDEEVNGRLLSDMQDKTSAKFLVRFDRISNESKVYPNTYFGEVSDEPEIPRRDMAGQLQTD